MTWWQAAILGLVEGVTEYLPVSSTGHLLVTQELLGINTGDPSIEEAANAYAIVIQAGAILAVLGLYRSHVRQMALGLAGRSSQGLRLLQCVIVAFLPAAVVGLTLDDLIKQYLFGMWPIVAAWIAGGIVILAVGHRIRPPQRGAAPVAGEADAPAEPELATPHAEPSLAGITMRMALIIGLIQCLAMWPGVSRSLVTILGGLLVGLSLPAAVEFSFLLGVVTLGAATCYDGLKHGEVMLATFGPLPLVIGFVMALLSAVVAVKWMVQYLNRHGLAIFGWYRIAVGVVVGTMLLARVIE